MYMMKNGTVLQPQEILKITKISKKASGDCPPHKRPKEMPTTAEVIHISEMITIQCYPIR